MRTTSLIVRSTLVLIGAAVSAISPPVSMALSQPDSSVLARTDRPVVLGAAPARVSLTSSSAPLVSMATLLNTLGGGERLMLVLRGVSTERQPGVLFQLFLDLPKGDMPDPAGPHYVGTVNFYRASPGSAGADIFESFDVTDTARAIEPLQKREESTTVTIAPVGTPVENARPTIARLEIVRQ